MESRLPTVLTLAFGATGFAVGPAPAQVFAGGDATFADKYVWRGLTRASGWVFQGGLYAGVEVGSGFLTAEWWNNKEFGAADPGELTDAGIGRHGWTEQDWSVQLLVPVSQVVLGLGWVKYRFLGRSAAGGRGPENDTYELFGSLELRAFDVFAPKVSVWYDYDKVEGAYLEASGSFRVPITGIGVESSFYLDLIAGFSLGQGRSDDDLSYFRGSGPTHVALAPAVVVSLETLFERLLRVRSFPSIAVLVEPVRLQFNIDAETRRTSGLAIDRNRELSWRLLSFTISVATP